MSQLALAELSEREWELQIVGTIGKPGIARQVGFMPYHTLRSKGSAPGWPDWVLVRERVVYLELKRQDGKLSQPQKDWIRALLSAEAEVYVVRPSDLDAIGSILASRGDPFKRFDQIASVASVLRESTVREVTPA